MTNKNQVKKVSWITAMALVIANMIGTGVFTSLGFQLGDLTNTGALVVLWLLGGIYALSGAFSYSFLGKHIRESGGEYVFLSRLINPFIGYLSGWVSLTVGFAAPIALAAMALDAYLIPAAGGTKIIGILVIVFLSVIHSFNLSTSSIFQNWATALKIIFIFGFVAIGLFMTELPNNAIEYSSDAWAQIATPAFFIAFIFVTYSYSGWNAAAYILEELEDPDRNLGRALVGGTLLVTVLYTLLQFVLLKHASFDSLIGQVEVGAIAAGNMFSPQLAEWFNYFIALLLVSSISAMIWTGPRVVAKMGEDYGIWSFLKPKNGGVPVKAIWFQAVLSIILIVFGLFEAVLIYCGLLLVLSSVLTVLSSFRLYLKSERDEWSITARLLPVWQLIFLLLSLGMIIMVVIDRPVEFLFGMLNLVLGAVTFYINKHINVKS
jgi:APA family basic amino acid/polyamine antiporter